MLYKTGLKRMVAFAVAAVIMLPVFSIFFVVPCFQDFLTSETQRQAVRIAAHLAGYLSKNLRSADELLNDPGFIDEIEAIRGSLEIWRVKIFSLDGRLLYSSAPGDRSGGDSELFSRAVREGRAASRMIRREVASQGGGRTEAWMVETYVPLEHEGSALGIFEIYKDVTASRSAINHIAMIANVSVSAVGVFLLAALIIVTRRAFREIAEREKLLMERRQMEKDIAERSRSEAIATLTAGISHDFNNILTAVLAHLNIARMQVEPDSDIYKSLDEADRAALIARDLTRQLMAIARPEPVAACVSDTRRIIENSVPLAHDQARVEVKLDLPPALPQVMVERELVVQALQAVIVNAGQVSRDGVPVVVSAEAVDVDDGEVDGLAAGSYVRVSVSDSGPGIPDELKDRIFDPYFTTRERDSSRGVGLGLAFCKSVIDKHKGAITVDSELDRGTTFHIYLPVCSPSGDGE